MLHFSIPIFAPAEHCSMLRYGAILSRFRCVVDAAAPRSCDSTYNERYCGGSCACRCATRGGIVSSGCRHRIGCDASTTTCPSGPACASRALSSSVRLCATGIVLRNSPTGSRRGCISRAAVEAITAQLRTTRGPGASRHSSRCCLLTNCSTILLQHVQREVLRW